MATSVLRCFEFIAYDSNPLAKMQAFKPRAPATSV
jgi:hypothetical protein